LSCYIARPFNHIGPGQHDSFVCPALAKRIKLAKNGDSIDVGNIHAKRDFSDVRDIARAYRLILEIQPSERIFVLGSSKTHSVLEVIQIFTKISGKSISTRISPDLLRPNDNATICADTALAQKILGWQCKIEFESTLNDIFQASE
jgi:GDP-4-dehydro-6-deoxy-D-mannose reductase